LLLLRHPHSFTHTHENTNVPAHDKEVNALRRGVVGR